MCGRFASQLPAEFIARLFRTTGDLPNTLASWNVAPTQATLVVQRDMTSGNRRLRSMSWGLVQKKATALASAKRLVNFRGEIAARSNLTRNALLYRRCLVPANAFYEWKAVPDGKQPYAIARADGAPLAFAGLWESWRDTAGEVLRTFTIATTAASEDMAGLHNRMPVILEEAAWPVWLGEESGDYTGLMRPAPVGTVRLWPVSRAVNNVRNNGPELLDQVDDPHAPPPSDAPAGDNSQ